MGLIFSLIYIVVAYLAPQTVFGDMAEYRLELYIAVLAIVFTMLSAQGSGLGKIPQTVGILGLAASVVLSTIFAGLTREAPAVLTDVTTSVITFFLVVINVRKLWQLKLLVMLLLGCGLFIVIKGWIGMSTGDVSSPYVLAMSVGGGEHLMRIRGLSFLNDPNDLSQFIVGMIPCAFLFWKKGRSLTNLLFVLVPVGVLLYGMFLSHSRGGMIALIVAAMVANRRKIGLVPAAVVGGLLFVALSAAGWGGGRDVSAESGMERMEAWSTGMQLIRSHPVFGVGYQRFNEFYYITAHNSVIVVAAELGMVGLFFWMLFVFPTVRDAVVGTGDKQRKAAKEAAKEENERLRTGRPAGLGGGLPTGGAAVPELAYAAAGAGGFGGMYLRREAAEVGARGGMAVAAGPAGMLQGADEGPEEISKAELERMSGLMLVSLAGFFAAGWFLSRSYTMALYVNMGIAAVVYRMARDRGAAPEPLTLGKASKYSAILSVILVLVVYVIVRLEHLLPR